jgi:predicted MFS family arabinose efflux permease
VSESALGLTPAPIHRVRTARWALLLAFAALVASTQVLWLSFAPVTTRAADALGVSEGAIGDLAVVNPVLYVLLAIPAGRWADRRFGLALSTGAALTAGGALLRALKPDSYGWVLAGQIVLSVGQPLVLNATTKVAARWFPATERTRAIAVGSGAQFLGILIAATTASALMDAGGLSLLLGVHAAFAAVGAVALVVALALVPPAFAPDAGPAPSLRWLRHDRLLLKLAAMLFVGVGLFNALATWLDPILADLGMPNAGGTIIATTTIAGLVGTAVLPDLAARRDRRRTVLLTTTVLAVVTFPLVAVLPTLWLVAVALAVVGFFLLAGLPIALDWSELEAGPERAATATCCWPATSVARCSCSSCRSWSATPTWHWGRSRSSPCPVCSSRAGCPRTAGRTVTTRPPPRGTRPDERVRPRRRPRHRRPPGRARRYRRGAGRPREGDRRAAAAPGRGRRAGPRRLVASDPDGQRPSARTASG